METRFQRFSRIPNVPAIERITYFNCSNLEYASFYLAAMQAGSADHQPDGYQFRIASRVPAALRSLLLAPGFEELRETVFLFRAQGQGVDFFFCIDMRDSGRCGNSKGYHLPLLAGGVRYYFKANIDEQMLAEEPLLQAHRDRIVAIEPPFPVRIEGSLLSWLRIAAGGTAPAGPRGFRRRIRTLRALHPIDQFRQLRGQPPSSDVFFVMTHYSQAHHAAVAQTRYEIIRELRQHKGIQAVAGLAASRPLPEPFESVRVPFYPLPEYLRRLAGSRVGIYVRGPHDALAFKFGEMLALGLPIVGQKILHNRSLLAGLPRFDEQFAFETPAEIVAQVATLLQDPTRLAALRGSNTAVFERHLTPAAAMQRIVATLNQPR